MLRARLIGGAAWVLRSASVLLFQAERALDDLAQRLDNAARPPPPRDSNPPISDEKVSVLLDNAFDGDVSGNVFKPPAEFYAAAFRTDGTEANYVGYARQPSGIEVPPDAAAMIATARPKPPAEPEVAVRIKR